MGVGMHEMSLLLRIEEGQMAGLHLTALTTTERFGKLEASTEHLEPVEIGCRVPPLQIIQLHNTGTCRADYSLDLSALHQINQDNYNFPIFELSHGQQGNLPINPTSP